MRKFLDFLRSRSRFIEGLFAVFFLQFSVGALSDRLQGECQFGYLSDRACNVEYQLCVSFLLVWIFVTAAWHIHDISKELFFYRKGLSGRMVTPHRVLIVAVSTLRQKIFRAEDGLRIEGLPNPLSGNLSQDIQAFTDARLWVNNQQFLRAVEPHLQSNRLERVFLIGSGGENGSYALLDDVEKLLRLYNPELNISKHGGDDLAFENLDLMAAEYDGLVEMAKCEEYGESDIILDVTGGQKTASIAAAMVAFQKEQLKFQYVETNGDHPMVRMFDIKIEASPKFTA